MNQSNSNTNLTLDAFPFDSSEQYDNDSDGVGDNADKFPDDPISWRDPYALPSEVIIDRKIKISEISLGKDITYDGTYFYILNYDYEDKKARKVFQFYNNFSFTGLAWNYTNHIENPTGIDYYDGNIYIIDNKYEPGVQPYILKFSIEGHFKDSTKISSNVDYAQAITSSDYHLYICDSEATNTSIHIYNANTLSHVGAININHYPFDIIVHETGYWCYINNQSLGEYRLYLYDLYGNYQYWSLQFYQKNIELVGDTLIALSGDKIYIYKLF